MPVFSRANKLRGLIALSFLLFAYASIWSWKPNYFSVREQKGDTIYERKGKVLLLLSNQRSGSTFVGEFFNRFQNGFYLYEPLLPFTPTCEPLYQERLELLKEISQCDFRKQLARYESARDVFRVTSHKECRTQHICSPGHHPTLLQRYFNLCQSVKENYGESIDSNMLKNAPEIIAKLQGSKLSSAMPEACRMPLNLTLWSALCYSSELVAYKILRVCSVSALEGIAKRLTDMGNQVYIIELVRDPRAIINSALKLELRKSALGNRLDLLCGRYRRNIEYVDEQMKDPTKNPTGIVTGGKYRRIRYEDIAADPVKGATNIYNWLGMPLPDDVRKWINETSIDPKATMNQLKQLINDETISEEQKDSIKKKLGTLGQQQKSAYGTVRDPQEVLVKWRKNLPMHIINTIQDECGDVMNRIGYKLINSVEERNDFETQLW